MIYRVYPSARLSVMLLSTTCSLSLPAAVQSNLAHVQNSVIVNSLQCSHCHSYLPVPFFSLSYPVCASALGFLPSEETVYPLTSSTKAASAGDPSASFPPSRGHQDHYILELLTLLFAALPLFLARLCFSSRKVTKIQNQLMTSTKAKAKKTLFLSPSPPQVLAA